MTTEIKPTITLHYRLTEAAARAELAAGRIGTRDREIVLDPTPELASSVLCTLTNVGNGQIDLRQPIGLSEVGDLSGGTYGYASLGGDVQDHVIVDAADAQRAVSGRVAELVAKQASLRAGWDERHREPTEAELAERAAKTRAKEEQEERRRAEDAARRAIQERQITEWIAAHGSDRLRLAVEAGLLDQSTGIYRDERIAYERPGWEDASYPVREILNPSEDALRILLDARKSGIDAALVSADVAPHGSFDWRPALECSYVAPGINPTKLYRILDSEDEGEDSEDSED